MAHKKNIWPVKVSELIDEWGRTVKCIPQTFAIYHDHDMK